LHMATNENGSGDFESALEFDGNLATDMDACFAAFDKDGYVILSSSFNIIKKSISTKQTR